MKLSQKEQIEKASRCLKALSNPVRLAILCVLKDGEKSVQQLELAVGTSQSNMSTHLATMRDKELLVTRREGVQVFYSVKDEKLFQLLALLQDMYCPEDPEESQL
jgi:ArsR family transcriptional regulator